MAKTALVTQINHLSSHDGRGVRLSIFFKGCPLRCIWCHNPETYSFQRDLMWNRNLCIGCNECVTNCTTNALQLGSTIEFVNRDLCAKCGKCVEKCPSKALYFASKEYTVENITTIIKKDMPLFNSMNGGVTFSGGEPAMQANFILHTISQLANSTNSAVHFALDTSGYAPQENYERLLPYFDQILFDIKAVDSQKHKEFTGKPNELILNNLSYICNTIKEQGLKTKIWIRTPLIPGYTANKDTVSQIASYIASSLPLDIVERWELCCFNNMCIDKYRRMGIEWSLSDAELLTKSETIELLECAKHIIPNFDIRAMGLQRKEN